MHILADSLHICSLRCESAIAHSVTGLEQPREALQIQDPGWRIQIQDPGSRSRIQIQDGGIFLASLLSLIARESLLRPTGMPACACKTQLCLLEAERCIYIHGIRQYKTKYWRPLMLLATHMCSTHAWRAHVVTFLSVHSSTGGRCS
jgi:hypothetical protein